MHLTYKFASTLNCVEENKGNEVTEQELKAKFEEEMKKRRVASMKNL